MHSETTRLPFETLRPFTEHKILDRQDKHTKKQTKSSKPNDLGVLLAYVDKNLKYPKVKKNINKT